MKNTINAPAQIEEYGVDAKAESPKLIHLHFGTGRLGLGLIAPWFQKPGSEHYLFNRAVSRTNATGATALDPAERNELLRNHPEHIYLIQKPGESATEGASAVHYEDFIAYDEDNLEDAIHAIAVKSIDAQASVIVTASVLQAENYRGVIQALNVLSQKKEAEPDAMGRIFLVACENTLSAHEVFEHESTKDLVTPETRRHVTPVHALVDRMCVAVEADHCGTGPTVVVRAEEYGLVKLELRPETEDLVEVCRNSRIEWSRHVDIEKQIKSWQLNGTHWLIALHALETHDDIESDFKLNEFFASSPENRQFAEDVMREMSEGIAILLRSDPAYADFAREVDVEAYLDSTAKAILRRFETTDDSITRILARFHTPTSDELNTIQSFSKRFADRVDEPLNAYKAEKGAMPPAATQSIMSLFHLISKGIFIDTLQSEGQPVVQAA